MVPTPPVRMPPEPKLRPLPPRVRMPLELREQPQQAPMPPEHAQIASTGHSIRH
jgi:hypothetical protein